MILQEKEQELLRSKLDREITPMLILESQSKVDTGGWVGKKNIRVIVTPEELFLIALGKRPLVEYAQLEDCNESRYNPSSGEMILAPATSLRNRKLSLRPLEAMKLLKALGVPESTGKTVVNEHVNDESDSLHNLSDSTFNAAEDF